MLLNSQEVYLFEEVAEGEKFLQSFKSEKEAMIFLQEQKKINPSEFFKREFYTLKIDRARMPHTGKMETIIVLAKILILVLAMALIVIYKP